MQIENEYKLPGYNEDPLLVCSAFKSEMLTKREKIAAMAMQGILSNADLCNHVNFDLSAIASQALNATDELLKQLEK